MKVVADNRIPFLEEALRAIPCVELTLLPAGEITPDAVRDADALIVRTRTRCDAQLLGDSKVTLIATATIGTDHIDIPWCESRGITVANAPGCNAPAVAQWVIAAAETMLGQENLAGETIGIVGVGHVGSIVSAYAQSLGMRVMECDPPRGLPHTLDRIVAEARIVTFHTPLTVGGENPTFHLLDVHRAALLRPDAIVMNAARGPVTDTAALLIAIGRKGVRAAIDCWEGEPALNSALLEKAAIATPHIAGYSLQGKQRATRMAVEALCRHFRLPLPQNLIAPQNAATALSPGMASDSYDILADTRALRSDPAAFESLRNNYKLRNEILNT